MITKQKVAARREIFSHAKKVYITFDANNANEKEFILIFKTEDEACNFAVCFEKLLKEVDAKGHHNTKTYVQIFTNQPKRYGNIQIGNKKFNFNCKEKIDVREFHDAFVYEVWGDIVD